MTSGNIALTNQNEPCSGIWHVKSCWDLAELGTERGSLLGPWIIIPLCYIRQTIIPRLYGLDMDDFVDNASWGK